MLFDVFLMEVNLIEWMFFGDAETMFVFHSITTIIHTNVNIIQNIELLVICSTYVMFKSHVGKQYVYIC